MTTVGLDMSKWLKRIAHRLAVTLYSTLELRDLPKIRERPEKKKEEMDARV